jgi:hypothetical protein
MRSSLQVHPATLDRVYRQTRVRLYTKYIVMMNTVYPCAVGGRYNDDGLQQYRPIAINAILRNTKESYSSIRTISSTV